MRTRLANLWEKLRSSYWFLPTMMAIGAVALSFGTIYLDIVKDPPWSGELAWLYLSEPEAARALLSTVAGATITVTGVVFSITIVALTLASQQFGPRLLYNFMRDRGNQAVFGTFIATYLYCLLVLRTVRGGIEGSFVPHYSVLTGFVLSIISVGVLIYFIHHVADSIQAMSIIASVHHDLQRAIDHLYPDSYDQQKTTWLSHLREQDIPRDFSARAIEVRSPRNGYLQAVDMGGLLELAARKDQLIRLERRPGDYLMKESIIARVLVRTEADQNEVEKHFNGVFIVGRQRTQEQDIEFLLHELVEIAIRALSPGINDPYTAITCIDRLGSALAELAGRAMPPRYRFDAQEQLRLITHSHTFTGLVNSAFNQVRQFGLGYVSVTIRLLEMIAAIIPFTRDEEQRKALLRQAAMIDHHSSAAFPEENDRRDIHQRYLAIFDLIEQHFGLTGGAR